MNRRELLKAAAALPLVQTVLAKPAFAQGGYPTRNITMIVPFPAGGQADLAARPVALALERIMGKPPERRNAHVRFDGISIEEWSYITDYVRRMDTTITFVGGKVDEIRAAPWESD